MCNSRSISIRNCRFSSTSGALTRVSRRSKTNCLLSSMNCGKFCQLPWYTQLRDLIRERGWIFYPPLLNHSGLKDNQISGEHDN